MNQQSNNSSYVVGVGEAGKQRLALLNNVYGPYSEHFLQQAGIKPGMQVLEVGCGTGNMTCRIAKLLGNTGHITALDISEEQLAIAREQAKQNNLTNITFVQAAAENILSLNKKFDLAYCRFLLMHTLQPQEVLKSMIASLKTGGILACEEPAMSSSFSQPPSLAFAKGIQMLMQYGEKLNFDFDLGDKLYHIYKTLGLKNIHINIEQPVATHGPEKRLRELAIIEASAKYIAQGIATQNEIDHILQEINLWAARDDSYLGCPRINQVWATR